MSSLISSNSAIMKNSWAQRTVLYLVTLCLEASNKWFVPGPVLLNIFVNDLEEVVQHTLLEYGDETKLKAAVNIPERPRQGRGMGQQQHDEI